MNNILIKLFVFLSFIASINMSAQSAKKFAKLARADEKKKNYTSAVANYSKAIELKPTNYKYLIYRANCYRLIDNKKESLKDYEAAFQIKKSDKWLFLRIMDVAIELEEFEKSIKYGEELIIKDKKNIEAYQQTAWSYIRIKQFQKAIEKCATAIEFEQYSHKNHYLKALALDSLKRHAEANIEYVIAIKLLKNYELDEKKLVRGQYKSYFFNHAFCLYNLRNYTDAINEYNYALEIDAIDIQEPKNYLVYYRRSQAYLGKEDYLNPLGDLNKCLVLNNKFVEGFYQRAEVYVKTSQFQSAISDFTKVVLLDPKNHKAFLKRGESYQELGNFSEAINDYKSSLALTPNNKDIQSKLDFVTKKLYEANRESDNPDVKITYPFIDGAGYVNVYTSQTSMIIEGSVKDKSLISSISVNGVQASFAKNDKNPDFTIAIPVPNEKYLEVKVKDIYANETTKKIKLGKIFDETRVMVNFAGTIVSEENNKQVLSGKKVYLTNEKGEVFYSTTTDVNGKFNFERLPYDKNYLLAFDVEDNTQLSGIKSFVVLNNKGETILKSEKNEKGKFTFEVLKNDQMTLSLMSVEDAAIEVDMKGKLMAGETGNTPLSNINILLVNEKGEIIVTRRTDANGLFIFKNLLPSQNYIIKIDEQDSKTITYNRIIITDEQNHVIREINRDEFGKFSYKLLKSETIMLSSISEEISDPWIGAIKLNVNKKEMSIIENIYYASGSFYIPKDAEVLLEKTIKALTENPKLILEVQSHTDAVAGDDYNMELSQKRANAVVDYLIQKGIDKKRLIAKGFGETMLANTCGNGVDCSDAEHKQNRRTVFKLNYEGTK